jgi:hypothetical protein
MKFTVVLGDVPTLLLYRTKSKFIKLASEIGFEIKNLNNKIYKVINSKITIKINSIGELEEMLKQVKDVTVKKGLIIINDTEVRDAI